MSETFSVETSLDRWVAEEEVPRLPDGKWHASSLFGCARQAVYAFRGTEETEPKDNQSKRVLRVGQVFHDIIQKAIARDVERGILLAAYNEVPVDIPELLVRGSCDTLVLLSNGKWELWEFKSIKSTGLKFKDLPKEDHVGQWATYCRALRDYGSKGRIGETTYECPMCKAVLPWTDGRSVEAGDEIDEYWCQRCGGETQPGLIVERPGGVLVPPLEPFGDELDSGRIIYVSKDDLTLLEFHLHWSDYLDARVTKAAEERLAFHGPGPGLPPRLPLVQKKDGLVKDWRCGYCAYATKCWDIDDE